jgi:hypothetical protein
MGTYIILMQTNYPTEKDFELDKSMTQSNDFPIIRSATHPDYYYSNPIPDSIYLKHNLPYYPTKTTPTIFAILSLHNNTIIYLHSETLEIVDIGVFTDEIEPYLYTLEITPNYTLQHPL